MYTMCSLPEPLYDNNKESPLVSVIIPSYNRAVTLPRAINSALSQSIDNLEVIVVDDGSTDNTEAVVTEYNDDRIRYIPHETNRGQGAARNTCLRNARGEFISYLDSDDEFTPSHLATAVKTLGSLPNYFAGVMTGHADTREDNKDDYNFERKEVYQGPFTRADIERDMFEKIGGLSTLTIRRSIIDTIGYHDESIKKCADLDFYLQILDEFYLYGINSVLCKRYKQSNSISINPDATIDGELAILRKHGGSLSGMSIAKRRYNRAQALFSVGRYTEGIYELFRGVLDISTRGRVSSRY